MFYHIKQSEGSQADWSSSHRWAFCVAFYVALCSVLLQILPSGWRKGKWVHQSFFFFWLCCVFIAAWTFSIDSCGEWGGGYSLLQCTGFSLR